VSAPALWRSPLPLPGRMMTVIEVAEAANVSARLVYRSVERGELVASKLGGRLRFEPDMVQAWIDRQRVQPPTPAPAPEVRRRVEPSANGLRRLLDIDREGG